MLTLKEKANIYMVQFLGSLIVGFIAAIVDISALYILTEFFNTYYVVSSIISFGFGLVCNYLLSIRFVFGTRTLNNPWAEFVIFGTIGAIGLVFNTLLIWSLTSFAGFYYILSKCISTVVVFSFNFLMRKTILFR